MKYSVLVVDDDRLVNDLLVEILERAEYLPTPAFSGEEAVELLTDKSFDIVITEIGGTVGDIESLPYIEALRQMKWELGNSCLVIHLTLIPYLAASGELKTKPTQHSVKTFQEAGVQPDILVCRTERPLNDAIKRKIALYCNVSPEAVIESIDAKTIYQVPLFMLEEELDKVVLNKLQLPAKKDPDLDHWKDFLTKLKNPRSEARIALIGKYVELRDAYKSIAEAFIHAGVANECSITLERIHSEDLNDDNVGEKLQGLNGILVAPGFGERGIEGKISAIKFARENNIPFLGICLGMQCAVIEFGRNVLGFKDAHSTEINPDTSYPVIDIMQDQKKITTRGGTMRLGAYPCNIIENTRAFESYEQENISERHRHRYEYNNEYLNDYEKAGMICSGINPEGELVEIIELKDHPWFVGVQFHPEYKSTVAKPHPLFVNFVRAAVEVGELVN